MDHVLNESIFNITFCRGYFILTCKKNMSSTTTTTTTSRMSVPLDIQSNAPPRKSTKLSNDKIIAIVLIVTVSIGIIMMGLAFAGVFNETPTSINLTPSITLTPGINDILPV